MISADVYCSICDTKEVVTFCLVCRELYCDDCSERHGHFGATKNHCTIDILSGKIRNLEDVVLDCFSCKSQNLESTATFLCLLCQELFCEKCNISHSMSEITEKHQVTRLSCDQQRTKTKAPIKMAGKKQEESSDDGQFAYDIEGTLHITGATNVDATVTHPPLSYLSSGTVTEEKVDCASNIATRSVTKMTYVGDFDVRLDSDIWGCSITGIVYLSDGRVVISDVGNKKVKVYSPNCNYLYCVKYSGYVYGIAAVSANKVVMIDDNTLRCLQLDSQSGYMLDKNIDLPRGVCAVSHAARTFAILYPFSEREVAIINDSGVKLTVIKLTEVKGDIPRAILLDSSGTRFYICDDNNSRVLCYSCLHEHTGVLWECSVSPKPYSVVHVGDSLVVVCQKKVH